VSISAPVLAGRLLFDVLRLPPDSTADVVDLNSLYEPLDGNTGTVHLSPVGRRIELPETYDVVDNQGRMVTRPFGNCEVVGRTETGALLVIAADTDANLVSHVATIHTATGREQPFLPAPSCCVEGDRHVVREVWVRFLSARETVDLLVEEELRS
jgi:hypothetical protein